jgi:hypothetical protein
LNGWNTLSVRPSNSNGGNLEQPAQLDIEGRRGLDPAPVEEKLGVPVHGEHFAAQQFQQLRRGQVVAHISQSDACRDAAVARAGSQQQRLGHTVGLAGLQLRGWP